MYIRFLRISIKNFIFPFYIGKTDEHICYVYIARKYVKPFEIFINKYWMRNFPIL